MAVRRQRASNQHEPGGSTSSKQDPPTASPNNDRVQPQQSTDTGTYGYVRFTFRAVGDDSGAHAAPEPPMQFEPTVDGQSQTPDANALQGQNEDRAESRNLGNSPATVVSLLSPQFYHCILAFDKPFMMLTLAGAGNFQISPSEQLLRCRQSIDRQRGH